MNPDRGGRGGRGRRGEIETGERSIEVEVSGKYRCDAMQEDAMAVAVAVYKQCSLSG